MNTNDQHQDVAVSVAAAEPCSFACRTSRRRLDAQHAEALRRLGAYRTAIDACDTLIKRLTGDAEFLENWPQVCREIMRKHGVSERRIRLYVIRAEEENVTTELLDSNAQLAMLLQARKLDLRGRLVMMEQEATPTDSGDAGGLDK